MLENLERVASAVSMLATETRDLAAEVRTENLGRKRQNKQQTVLVCLVLVGLVIMGLLLVRQQADLSARSKAAAEQRKAQFALSQQINDCITPTGGCYQRNQTNQAEVIRQLVQVSVVANRCSVLAEDDVAQFDACLKQHGVTIPLPSVAPGG